MNIKFQFEKIDKNKKVIDISPKYQSYSFVENFIKLLYKRYGGTGVLGIAIDGTQRAIVGSYNGLIKRGGDDNGIVFDSRHAEWPVETRGIIVGTGTQAVALTDYSLQTPIDSGSESGELLYLPCSINNFETTSSAGTSSFEIIRLFRNESNSTVTINEMGIYMELYWASSASYYDSAMIIRDIVSPGQTVDDGEYLKATYTIQIAV